MATKKQKRERKEYMLKYQRGWIRERRASFFDGKVCTGEGCDVTEDLMLHHVNPEEKEGHAIWSWSEERRKKEIAKCVVLCRQCHAKVHVEMGTYASQKGEDNAQAKLREHEVVEIKKRLKSGNETQVEIARDYNVTRGAIGGIARGQNWKHVVI